jgi:hypothetical protein
MADRIEVTSFYNDSRIVKIDVLDTIYQKDLDEVMRLDTIRLEFLKERLSEFDSLKDVVRRTPRPINSDSIGGVYVKGVFDSLMMYDRWVDMMNGRNRLYERMNYYGNNKTDIVGYRVVVHYKNGRVNNFVIESDYSVVCPTFMLEPIDSVISFRPNTMRRPPMRRPRMDMGIQRPNIMERNGHNNDRLPRFDKQTNGVQQGDSRPNNRSW